MITVIDRFIGRWGFLSNYYPCQVDMDGCSYPSVEHAYQAAKTLDPRLRNRIRDTFDPDEAKHLGRKYQSRLDWETVKLALMRQLVAAKFADPSLRLRLLETGDAVLVEGNDWGDTYWGVCDGVGVNHLGRILMNTRAEACRGASKPSSLSSLRGSVTS
jgi:ribA/ribD-fused uncharacterized protein